ncbi:type IV pilus modification PilV family protein [Nocardioides sp. HB32]
MADRRRYRQHPDGGFTLIEVIVAMGIFLVVTTALLPQFIAGIRSVSKADREGVTNGILQQQLERLRGLPYRVSLGSGEDGTDQPVDLLDLYFPNLTAPATGLQCTVGAGLRMPTMADGPNYGTGYVSGAGCSYEPAAGAFYRTVKPTTDAELGGIALVFDTQFVTGGSAANPTPAVATPRASYNSSHAITNYPPAPQVAVTVTVLYRDRGTVTSRSMTTQIAKHDSGPTLVRAKVDAAALTVTSQTVQGANESLSAGLLSIDGSVGDISTVDVSGSGAVSRLDTGDPASSPVVYGATHSVSAPPSDLFGTVTDPGLGSSCSDPLCFGATSLGTDAGVGISTDSGLPSAGSASSPLRAALTDPGAVGLSFDNIGTATPSDVWTARPVRLTGSAPGTPSSDPAECPRGLNADARLSGSGFLTTAMHSGSTTVRDVTACGAARSATVSLLPTAATANGVLRISLNRSYAWCKVTGGVATGGTGLDASVQVPVLLGGTGAPVAASTFSLADYPLLKPYLESWTFDAGSAAPNGGSVSSDVPGIRVVTKPTRLASGESDPDSGIVVTIGATSCSAESTS